MIADQIDVIKEAAGKEKIPTAAFSLPENVIDDILRSGGGQEGSRERIYARIHTGRTPKGMVDFLKAEYGLCGKGYEIGGRAVSVWFERSGMRIAEGMSAKIPGAQHLSWEEIESKIRRMYEEGSYIDGEAALFVLPKEQDRMAEKIVFFFRDGIDADKLGIMFDSLGFPEQKEQIRQILDIQLKALEKHLADQQISFAMTDEAKDFLADRGYDPQFGARPLKRVVVQDIETPVSRLLISGELHEGMRLVVEKEAGAEKLAFHCKPSGEQEERG